MSSAFVKDEDGEEEFGGVPDRAVSTEPNYITEQGYERMCAEAARLQHKLDSLDGSEVGGQLDQAEVERDLRLRQARLRSAVVVPVADGPRDRVAFGARVEVAQCETGEHQTYRIVGVDEIDASAGNVSWASPLARALMGARVGDVVLVDRPAGKIEVEVMRID